MPRAGGAAVDGDRKTQKRDGERELEEPLEPRVTGLVRGKGCSSHEDQDGARQQLTEDHADPEAEGPEAARPQHR